MPFETSGGGGRMSRDEKPWFLFELSYSLDMKLFVTDSTVNIWSDALSLSTAKGAPSCGSSSVGFNTSFSS